MNLYVSNLGTNVMDDDLKKIFSAYGPVSSAKVIMDRFTNRSRGFGFVEMPDNESAEKAIKGLDGVMNDGRSIKVSEARPRQENTDSRNSFKKW